MVLIVLIVDVDDVEVVFVGFLVMLFVLGLVGLKVGSRVLNLDLDFCLFCVLIWFVKRSLMIKSWIVCDIFVIYLEKGCLKKKIMKLFLNMYKIWKVKYVCYILKNMIVKVLKMCVFYYVI